MENEERDEEQISPGGPEAPVTPDGEDEGEGLPDADEENSTEGALPSGEEIPQGEGEAPSKPGQ